MSTPEDLSNLDPAFDGVLRPVAAGATSCEYFQDRNKRWPFHCDDEGYRLLARLLRAATPVVGAVQAKIDAACDVEGRPDGRAAADAVVAEGQRIYARKPNMGEHDVTWSQLEYGHLGLQKEYIRYKSVQRLTEAWACLQRAKRAGLFFELDETPLMENESPSVPLRWASLGGGPGFELLAVKWFFEKHFPRYALDLVSLDLEASWREAAEGLGLRFSTWDVRDGDGLERAAGGPVDYAVASYVLKMYMANEPCARWLGEKLNRSPGTGGGLRAALVVSRDENLEAASRLMRDASIGNATVVPLMDPEGGGTTGSWRSRRAAGRGRRRRRRRRRRSPFPTCPTRSTSGGAAAATAAATGTTRAGGTTRAAAAGSGKGVPPGERGRLVGPPPGPRRPRGPAERYRPVVTKKTHATISYVLR